MRAQAIQINMRISWSDVSVRDFTLEDVDLYADYWFKSPFAVHVESTDPERFASKMTFLAGLDAMLGSPEQAPLQIIEFRGRTIGVHMLTNIAQSPMGAEADFQAHFFDPEMRGMGIGLISGVKAAKALMRRFQLKRLYAKSPKENPFTGGALAKLPVRYLGEETSRLPTGELTQSEVFVAEWGDLTCLEQFLRAKD